MLYCNNTIIKCYDLYIHTVSRYCTVRGLKPSKSIFYVNKKIVCKKKVKVCNKQKVGEINLDIKNRHRSLTPLVQGVRAMYVER